MNKMNFLYKRKTFTFIKLALFLALGYTVFRTLLILRSEQTAFVPNSASGAASKIPVARKDSIIEETKNSTESSIRDYSVIFERNLFGHPVLTSNEKKQPKVEDDSDTQDLNKEELGIALLGTVAGSPKVSRAIIEDLKTSVLSLRKVGDPVGSASIESIEKDIVVLLYQGQRKVVRLGARGSKRNEADNAESVLAGNTTGATERDRQDRKHETIADQIRYAVSMLPNAVIEPYAVDGEIEGLRITGIEEIQHLKDLGLKNGDVIRTVNGHLLTSKQEAYQISRKARSQAIIRVELLRDNKIETLSFDLG